MLDISTRLRIAEAELAIVKREVSELVAERNTLESQCRCYQESWKFALQQLGRTIEQRNELMAQAAENNTKPTASIKPDKSPEVRYPIGHEVRYSIGHEVRYPIGHEVRYPTGYAVVL